MTDIILHFCYHKLYRIFFKLGIYIENVSINSISMCMLNIGMYFYDCDAKLFTEEKRFKRENNIQ